MSQTADKTGAMLGPPDRKNERVTTTLEKNAGNVVESWLRKFPPTEDRQASCGICLDCLSS